MNRLPCIVSIFTDDIFALLDVMIGISTLDLLDGLNAVEWIEYRCQDKSLKVLI